MNKEHRFVENLANQLRGKLGLSPTEPIHIKSLLRKEGILTVYRPLDEYSYGLSIKSKNGDMFILVNSNSSRGKQHYTIAHELYHLYYDENLKPHLCHDDNGKVDPIERKANLFACAFLLPTTGVMSMIPQNELSNNISVATILKIEQYYQVSHITLLIRLKELGVIDNNRFEYLKSLPIKRTALQYGYDLSLYEHGNEGVVIGDFGERARLLYERERISEGHYKELLSLIGIYDEQE